MFAIEQAQGGSRLVGRSAELTTLLRHLDDGAAPSVLAISGDPGIGKTRLLREVGQAAGARGRTVLRGSATEFEQEVPFAVVVDALADAAPAHLAGLSADDAALLREILPGLPPAEGSAAAVQALRAERYRLYRAVRALLDALAEPAGLVLLLDDLHWADQGSAELLDFLLRHPPRPAVLIAMAYRPRQLSGRLRRLLAGAVQDGTATLVEPDPLTADEAADLLGPDVDDARGRRVYEVSGGNPFYLQALARTDLTEPTGPAVAADGDAPLPAPVRAALASELDALPPRQAVVAYAAAVVGDFADPALIAATAAVPPADALSTLDLLVRRDLLRVGPDGTRFRFRHPLVRRIAYEEAGAGWRVAAHARAAAALADAGAPAAERAGHVERSAAPGDLAAVAVLRQAATGVLHSGPATAAHWLGVALRLIPDAAGPADARLELLGMRAQALAVAGHLHESRAVMHELLDRLPPVLVAARAALARQCAEVERLFGRHTEANALLLAELAGLPDENDPAGVMLMVGLATGHSLGTHRDGQDWPARALAAARRVGERPELVAALTASVITDQFTGTVTGATTAHLDEAADLVDAMPDGELARLLSNGVWLATAEICHERPYAGLRHAGRTLAVARATGQMTPVGQLHTLHGLAYQMTGELVTAGRCFAEATDAAALVGLAELHALITAYQANLVCYQGDPARAVELAERAVAEIGVRHDFFAASAAVALAQAHLHAGDPATCTRVLLDAGGGSSLPMVDPSTRCAWFELLAMAVAAQGRPEQAAEWADRAEKEAGAWATPRRQGIARLSRVQALLPDDPPAALHAAREAAEAFAPYDRMGRGRAHLYAGTALALSGAPDPARAEFARARTLLAECGAHLFVAQVDREERRMNARGPRRRTAAGTTAPEHLLTPRELHVARLVTQGMTNRQIAETLFLSPKTVDVYLTRIYAKLGVPRRAALAELLTRAGAAGHDGGAMTGSGDTA